MNRTLIYARVSTEDQVEKYGLPLQLRACRDLSAARGYTVVQTITDDGISGTIMARPGLDRVRRMVAAGEVDIVLMVDVDRLSRELVHLLILKPEIERKAQLEFVNAKFEDSPSGRLFFGVRGVIAQYEREVTRDRTMRGKRERARTGLLVGGRVLFGYRYDQGRLIPDENRVGTVRDIFAWYEAGLSLRSIALRLRAAGVPTSREGQWGHATVRRMLTNETYVGVAHYGTHRREGKLLKVRDVNEQITIAVPSLIVRDQWSRVQALMALNPMRGAPSTKYLMRGLLHCGKCGRRMEGIYKREHVTYRCTGRDKLLFKGEPCFAAVNAKPLDAAVWATVARTFSDATVLRGLLREYQPDLREGAPAQMEQLAAQVRKLARKEQACLSALLDPDLAQDRVAIKAEHQKAQRQRQRAEADLAGIRQTTHTAASASEWLDETVLLLRDYIPTLTAMEERQSFLRGLIGRADWSGNEVKLECSLGAQLGITSSRSSQFEPLKVVVTATLAA